MQGYGNGVGHDYWPSIRRHPVVVARLYPLPASSGLPTAVDAQPPLPKGIHDRELFCSVLR